MNDTTWRNLSAVLGVACVVLIIAAGALLATSGESATPSPLDGSVASVIPSGSDFGPTGSPTPSPSSGPTSSPSGGPTATATVPLNAPIAAVTFTNLMLDSSTDPAGKARTFTFVTDGSGPVGITITKSSGKDVTRICATVDNSKPDCRVGTKVTYKGAFTDTAHSVWVITLIGNHSARPTVDIGFSWPSRSAQITLTHGRLQGSSSPGISEFLNGFTAIVKTNSAGNLSVAASWTVITTDVKLTTEEINGTSYSTVDQKQFTSATNLGTPGYTFAVGAAKFYRVSMRDLSADSMRPDLTAVVSVP